MKPAENSLMISPCFVWSINEYEKDIGTVRKGGTTTMRLENAAEYVTSTVRSRMPMFIGSVFIVFYGFAIMA